jgi:hypothetical protein
MIATCHFPGGTGRLTRDHAACSFSGRIRAGCRARTGDLLQITKALLIRER